VSAAAFAPPAHPVISGAEFGMGVHHADGTSSRVSRKLKACCQNFASNSRLIRTTGPIAIRAAFDHIS